jgi:hypothetical protein
MFASPRDYVREPLQLPNRKPVHLASQPAIMDKVMGIAYRTPATHLTKKAG